MSGSDLATQNLAAPIVNSVSVAAALPVTVFDRGFLVRSLAELGRFAEAMQRSAEGVRVAEAADQMWPVGWAQFAVGIVFLLKGAWYDSPPLSIRSGIRWSE